MSGFSVLSSLVFVPLAGAMLLAVLPRSLDAKLSPRMVALGIALLDFALSVGLLFRFNPADPGYQFVERIPWMWGFGISYYIGVDGISLFLLVLTTLLMVLVVAASRSIESKVRGYLAAMFVLQTGMLGTLVALDLFLFYLFWELMLAPMYFIIGIWGGKRRIYATLKFVLYTVAGSLLMLAAIVFVAWQYYNQQNEITFSLPELVRFTRLTLRQELWLFLAFALAFGIKVPIFPLHTWLPDAHVEAPTGGSVILAGVLLKMGLYGFLRFAFPLFPRAAEAFGPYLAVLAVIGIVYGALMAWVQTDMKKLVAYSSVSHLGFCVLGLAAINLLSLTGSYYQMLSHGVSTGALFFLVGVIYERRHTREISEFGGLASKLPRFAAVFMLFTLSSIALPLTNGFVGEFLILIGSFRRYPVLTGISLLGVVFGAVYMLTMYLKTFFGPLNEEKNGALHDLSAAEFGLFVPLIALVFYMGLCPKPITDRLEPSLTRLMSEMAVRKELLRETEQADYAGRRNLALTIRGGDVC